MSQTVSRTIKVTSIAAILGMSAAFSGCAPIIVGGAAATTAMIATDRRTVGEQVSDKEINLKVDNEMQVKFGPTARINASSYDGVVLLTGDAFSEKIRGEAAALTAAVPQVKSVINRLYVGPVASFSQITSDTWLSSKVKTTLLTTEGIPYGAVVVTVERDDVYLQGLVTQAEADKIAQTVAGVGGVKEVFTLFDIMTPEQARAMQESQTSNNGLPASNPTPTGTASMGGMSTNTTTPATSSSMGDTPPAGQPVITPVAPPSNPQGRPL